MNLESQVVSLELAKRLKELGVKQESVCIWQERYMGHWKPTWVKVVADDREIVYSAFTVAELGEMLPEFFMSGRLSDGSFACAVKGLQSSNLYSREKLKEADARAKLLIYLIEKGLVKP